MLQIAVWGILQYNYRNKTKSKKLEYSHCECFSCWPRLINSIMNVPNAFKLPLKFPLRGASGIFPLLSGEECGMLLWMKVLLPSMFQLSFADIPYPFTCMQHPRTVCNTALAQFGQPINWHQAQFLQKQSWGSLSLGDRKGDGIKAMLLAWV